MKLKYISNYVIKGKLEQLTSPVDARAERTLCNGVVQEQGYKKWEKALSDNHEAKFTRISDDTDVSLLYHTYFYLFVFLQTI